MKRHGNRRGIALAWTAIILFVMIGFVGLSMDWGKAVWNAHQLQNAADAASLAAAAYVRSAYLVARDPTQTYSYDYPYPEIVYHRGKSLAEKNYVEGVGLQLDIPDLSDFDPNADMVIGYWRRDMRTFTPFDPNNTSDPNARRSPNAVRAIGRRTAESAVNEPLSLLFGPLFGTQKINATRLCTTMDEGGSGAGLIVLREDPCDTSPKGVGLKIGGNAGLIVNGGDIQDNAASQKTGQEAFICQNNSLEIDCENMTVNGTADPNAGLPFNVNDNSGIVLPDPLRHVPALWGAPLQAGGVPAPPSPPGSVALPAYGHAVKYNAATKTYDVVAGFDASNPAPITGTTVSTYGEVIDGVPTLTLTPGYYPGGINLTNNNKIVLQPGVYAFGGGDGTGGASGLCVSGTDANLVADGVMIYVTASNKKKGGKPIWGKISLTGGHVTIREKYAGEKPSIPYAGYENSLFEFISIYQDRWNTSQVDITGGPDFLLKGTLYFREAHVKFTGGAINAGTQLVAGSVAFEGTGVVTINYDGRFASCSTRLYIVE